MAQEFVWVQQVTPDESIAKVGAYFVESSAPDNVDAPVETSPTEINLPEELGQYVQVDQPGVNEALQRIAQQLLAARRNGLRPHVIINVHGFNNPADVVSERLEVGWRCILVDPRLKDRSELVCIGYRWPSEKLGGMNVLRSALTAMPGTIRGAFFLAAGAWGLGALGTTARWRGDAWWRSLAATGKVIAGLPIAAVLLRSVVYYRDQYRALNYGVPDLVEWVRRLDAAIAAEAQVDDKGELDEPRVELSFIGHSMGALVVTQTVRILSDVFDPRAIPTETDSPPEIGKTLRLKNLVLVSPDISAAALLSGRANSLSSSLRRFQEIYLFSNSADVVLDIVSTLANYFSFPNRSSQFGHRLGNVEVVGQDGHREGDTSQRYGIVNLHEARAAEDNKPVPDRAANAVAPVGACVPSFKAGEAIKNHSGKRAQFFRRLRLGKYTLEELHQKLHQKQATTGTSPDETGDVVEKELPKLPLRFTYLDCTDALHPTNSEGKRVLGGSGTGKPLSSPARWWLLARYFHGNPDVHSGYFNVRRDFSDRPGSPTSSGNAPDAEDMPDEDAPNEQVRYTQHLIYRLAGLGLRGVLNLKKKPATATQTAGEPSDSLPDQPLPETPNADAVPPGEKQVRPDDATPEQWHAALTEFSQFCQKSGIKVLLSPEHYQPPAETDRE